MAKSKKEIKYKNLIKIVKTTFTFWELMFQKKEKKTKYKLKFNK